MYYFDVRAHLQRDADLGSVPVLLHESCATQWLFCFVHVFCLQQHLEMFSVVLPVGQIDRVNSPLPPSPG